MPLTSLAAHALGRCSSLVRLPGCAKRGAVETSVARRAHSHKDFGRMRRFVAILIAGAVAVTSVAAEAEPCPTMRAHALKRCCCPPAPEGTARLTCCTANKTNYSFTDTRTTEMYTLSVAD